MLLHMRTTVILPDDLFRRAKAKAAREGRTLTSLVEEALTACVDAPQRPRKRIVLPVGGSGGLQQGVDLDHNAALRDMLDDGHDVHQ